MVRRGAAMTALATFMAVLVAVVAAEKEASSSAVAVLSELPKSDRSTLLDTIKSATDGIQLAIQAASAADVSKMLKGIGDAVSAIPGIWGYAGVAFSLAASVVALVGGKSSGEDEVLAALSAFQDDFNAEMTDIQKELEKMNSNLNSIISGIDGVLSSISQVPAKVVAEMQMTAITVMKDKFANVQRSAANYANGDLTRDQMVAKCDDFDVASLFSELETILKDEKDLFGAKFGGKDRSNGVVQAQLLHFYMSVIPLVANCNSLKYSVQSIIDDGKRMQNVIELVLQRASWYLAAPDLTLHVRETFNPFSTAIDVDGYKETSGYELSLSFKAFSFAPPHARCFQVSDDGLRLTPVTLEPMQHVSDIRTFCNKAIATDDAPNRVAYAERPDTLVSILQPELGDAFDALGDRGWIGNATAFYSPKVGNWKRLPRLKLVTDFLILQANTTSTSLDELTESCKALGDGYDRDGDGHSKDYKGAPWTIFCLQYVERSLREIGSKQNKFLADVQFNNMDAGDAWDANCPSGYVRDANKVTVPSKISHTWLGSSTTKKSYAVCLKWAPMLANNAPDDFVARVWLNDSKSMASKPKEQRNEGKGLMALSAAPSTGDLADF